MKETNTNACQIRTATKNDLDKLCEFTREFLPEMQWNATTESARRVFERILTVPDEGILLVAQHEIGVCGYVYAAYKMRAEFGGRTVDIVELFVERAWRNKGVALSLLSALIENARRSEISRISVQVHSGNAAIERVLESAGFDPERRTLWGLRI
jgi:GNAT superfamily N-acetyltransferase